MKLVLFNDFVPGVVKGDRVVDISSVTADIHHTTPQQLMAGLIASFDQRRASIEGGRQQLRRRAGHRSAVSRARCRSRRG